MADRTEAVSTADGTMNVFVAHPDGAGPWPVVIQLMDALGQREELRDHARRAASWGYYVLAPDLFYRWGIEGPLDFQIPQDRDKIMQAMTALTTEKVIGDLDAALEMAAGDPAAKDGPIGLYGFCMGGRMTLQLAQAFGGRLAAGASIHPGGLVTDAPSSPHRHLDQISGELYFGIADQDAGATPEQMAVLEEALKGQDVRYQLEWHAGALHGYMMPGRSELYHRDAAEKVWGRMETLFARTLK